MAGGKFMGWLQNNPGVMQGIQGAVGSALGGIAKPQQEQQATPLQEKGVKKDVKQDTFIYIGLAAVVLLFLMKKK